MRANHERENLNQAVYQRIQADRLPWTMPYSELDSGMMDTIRVFHEALTKSVKPLDSDQFRVAPPLKYFENGTPSGRYAPDDARLLANAGLADKYLHFTRRELKHAGVFFLNRVGSGEQPIFGLAIPDDGSNDGYFHVEDRTFLTREEFDKVYRYQQKNGYGIGDRDAADVQTDMFIFTVRPKPRLDNIRKAAGYNSREDKYGLVRSPFIDSGFYVAQGIATHFQEFSVSADGKQYSEIININTTVLHLVNCHPDYPGVSEMYDPDFVADDQKYMSAGDFAKRFYRQPTTKEEAELAIQLRQPTPREKLWVGQWPE